MLQPKHPKPDKTPPAAGRFGLDHPIDTVLTRYRPAGAPSLEQFEARFRIGNDPVKA